MPKPRPLLAAVLVVAGFTLGLGGCASDEKAPATSAEKKADHPKADHPK